MVLLSAFRQSGDDSLADTVAKVRRQRLTLRGSRRRYPIDHILATWAGNMQYEGAGDPGKHIAGLLIGSC